MADEEKDWIRMHSAEALVEDLVRREFTILERAHIVCMGRPKATRSKGRVVWATTQKASPLIRGLLEDAGQQVDYVVVLAMDVWHNLTGRQQEALVFHELCHCAGQDPSTGEWALIGHDVEMFAREVRKYGAWKEDIRLFFATIEGVQLDLTPPPTPEPEPQPADAATA